MRRVDRRMKASTVSTHTVAMAETMAAGMMMTVASAPPAAARSATAVVGTNVRQALLRAKNVIIAGVTVFGSSLTVCSCSIALSPKGVAAFARPRMLAVMFIAMEPRDGWFLGKLGNNGRSNGVRNRAM